MAHLIPQSRQRAYHAVNSELIDLYWRVGEYISRRIESEGWGKGTIVALAAFIQRAQTGLRGFSSQNLWRMRQFYDTYRAFDKPKSGRIAVKVINHLGDEVMTVFKVG